MAYSTDCLLASRKSRAVLMSRPPVEFMMPVLRVDRKWLAWSMNPATVIFAARTGSAFSARTSWRDRPSCSRNLKTVDGGLLFESVIGILSLFLLRLG